MDAYLEHGYGIIISQMGEILDIFKTLSMIFIAIDSSYMAASLHSIANSLKSSQAQIVKASIKSVK